MGTNHLTTVIDGFPSRFTVEGWRTTLIIGVSRIIGVLLSLCEVAEVVRLVTLHPSITIVWLSLCFGILATNSSVKPSKGRLWSDDSQMNSVLSVFLGLAGRNADFQFRFLKTVSVTPMNPNDFVTVRTGKVLASGDT